MAKKIPGIQLARRIVLGVILGGVTLVTILHQLLQNIPSIDALCPFGGIETVYKFLAGGELIKRIMPGNIVLLAAILILGIVLSRFFCGWLCAFGALQGVFGWLGRKIFRKRFTVPPKVDRVLRWAKYPILAAILYFTWRTGTLVIRPYDPWAAYGHLPEGLGALWGEFAVGFVILVATLVLSMLYERAFCKYVCPLGAVNAILGRIPLFRIKRVESTCISCAKCDKSCPMNIDVSHPKAVDSPECISCMECVTVCPTKKRSLVATIGGKTVNLWVVAGVGVAIYLGSLGVGAILGSLKFTNPPLTSLAAQGSLKIEDIKGSSTWQMVADSFGLELDKLFREAGVDGSKVPPETKLKDTGPLIGADFEADTARFAVSKMTGIPYAGENAEAEPAVGSGEAAAGTPGEASEAAAPAASTPAAAPAPAAKPAAPAPAAPTAAKTTAAAPAATAPAPAAAPKPAAPAQASAAQGSSALSVPADFELEGTMTIREIAAALNATDAAVIAKLDLPADFPTDKTLKELKDQYGYKIPDLKTKIKQ